ncbi:MAG: hypothetical protein AB4050_19130 [Synechococcus sp.]
MSDDNINLSKYYEPYSYFARTLRTWLVSYGIGAPILIASQAELSNKLVATGQANTVIITFLVGVCIQILSALLYKYALWQLHLGELNFSVSKRYYKISYWFIQRLWPTIIFDVSTILSFVFATYFVLVASTV